MKKTIRSYIIKEPIPLSPSKEGNFYANDKLVEEQYDLIPILLFIIIILGLIILFLIVKMMYNVNVSLVIIENKGNKVYLNNLEAEKFSEVDEIVSLLEQEHLAQPDTYSNDV